MNWHGALSVFRFELRRTLTPSRLAVWLLLVMFPVFIVGVMKYYEPKAARGMQEGPRRQSYNFTFHDEELGTIGVKFDEIGDRRTVDVVLGKDRNARVIRGVEIPDEMTVRELQRKMTQPKLTELPELLGQLKQNTRKQIEKALLDGDWAGDSGSIEETPEARFTYPPVVWGFVFFYLIPEVITLFGLLLWVTPLVQAELEGRTWGYLAVRPGGRTSVLLGKYMTAVAWTALTGWTSATLCVLIAQPESPMRFWGTMVGLVGFSCIAYAALYSLIGVVLHRRAMVIAVGYTLVFEFVVTMIPAVINKLTVQYRLRNLLVQWMDWADLELPPDVQGYIQAYLLGDEPAWLHMIILGGIAVGLLFIASQFIRGKEYVTAEDD